MEDIRKLGESLIGISSASLYQQFDRETRIRMLGSCLYVKHGWGDIYPREMQWLAEQGVTPGEAVSAYQQWMDRKHVLTPVNFEEFLRRESDSQVRNR